MRNALRSCSQLQSDALSYRKRNRRFLLGRRELNATMRLVLHCGVRLEGIGTGRCERKDVRGAALATDARWPRAQICTLRPPLQSSFPT